MKQTGLKKTGMIVFWLLIWHLLALCVDNSVLLATPLQAARALAGSMRELLFWQTTACSLFRIGTGFFLGVSAGLLFAALACRFRLLEEVLSPIITLLKAVPVASFVVLVLIWWGPAFLAVAVCFLVVMPNLYINTLEGLKNADQKLLEMAAVFHMPFRNRFFYIYRPALKPFLLSSLKLALGMCWKSGVAAEVIGTPAFSIGERLYLSKLYLDTPGVFAWTAVVILLSFCFEKFILRLAESFFAWEPACSAARESGSRSALVCQGLSKAYGSLSVIRGLNAVYEPGKTYWLTSPSGSGKTTLLRLLCGLEVPDEGAVEPSLGFSYVFQEDRLCEEYSALRNVELVIGREGRKGREPGRAETALRSQLPGESLYKPCSQLSGGMKRRVALVRAMEAESDCVLLDEPFTGMDAATREKAEAYIRSRQQGRIVIIATHI